MQETTSPQVDEIIAGRYRILESLGTGGFGDTFLAIDEQLPSERKVVLKRLRPLKSDEATKNAVETAFRKEAQLLEDVGRGHPYIPELFAYFEDNGIFWLVQEYILGRTLQSLGRISSTTAKQLLIDILPILTFLHDRNLLHRDIKPDNIILRAGDQKPVLIDFGAVRETMTSVVLPTGATASSFVIGTHGYMPPEQAAGRPIFSSDLYALALTIITLLTGKTPQELTSDPVSGAILWRTEAVGIDSDLAEVLDKAIQPFPAQRFSTAQSMLDALQGRNFIDPTQATLVVAPQKPVAALAKPPSSQLPLNIEGATTTHRGSLLSVGIIVGFVLVALAIGVPLSILAFRSQGNPKEPTASELLAKQQKDIQEELNKTKQELEKVKNSQASVPPFQPATSSDLSSSNESSLSRDEAVSIVSQWLSSKGQVFSAPYDISSVSSIVTGALWQDLAKANGPVEWLRNNNSYYVYDASEIVDVLGFENNGQRPQLTVRVYENRTLHTPRGIDRNQSGNSTGVFTYDFALENGTWMISDYRKN